MLVLHSFAMFCLAVKGYAALPEHKDLHTAHAYTETDTDIVTEALKVHFPWIQISAWRLACSDVALLQLSQIHQRLKWELLQAMKMIMPIKACRIAMNCPHRIPSIKHSQSLVPSWGVLVWAKA